MFEILLTDRAVQDLKIINKREKHRILLKLRKFRNSPMTYARKLSNPKIGMYRFRVGDYRIIADIVENNILILRIGHRSKIYR